MSKYQFSLLDFSPRPSRSFACSSSSALGDEGGYHHLILLSPPPLFHRPLFSYLSLGTQPMSSVGGGPGGGAAAASSSIGLEHSGDSATTNSDDDHSPPSSNLQPFPRHAVMASIKSETPKVSENLSQ